MDEPDITPWIEMSEQDFNSALFLLDMHPRPIEIICFLCQQAAEKILKAILVSESEAVRRTHDLVALSQNMLVKHPELGEILPHCVRLTTYAVSTRYPYTAVLPTHAEEISIEDARQIMLVVKSIIMY